MCVLCKFNSRSTCYVCLHAISQTRNAISHLFHIQNSQVLVHSASEGTQTQASLVHSCSLVALPLLCNSDTVTRRSSFQHTGDINTLRPLLPPLSRYAMQPLPLARTSPELVKQSMSRCTAGVECSIGQNQAECTSNAAQSQGDASQQSCGDAAGNVEIVPATPSAPLPAPMAPLSEEMREHIQVHVCGTCRDVAFMSLSS